MPLNVAHRKVPRVSRNRGKPGRRELNDLETRLALTHAISSRRFARADAQHVQQLPQLVSAYYVDHELLSTLQDYSPAPSAEGTRIELTPVSFNSQTPNSEAPIPWYQDYNPDTMFALHSIVEVTHALNYQLTQLMGPSGGTNP
ncbi:hypothetical protein [Metallibacterium sp.]|uniref:hypothetical protein n=1 Tax=Metallibacterium sp. TaxID=2940281 RepID=UPI002624EA7E|nr:hypothetical protein [Metallibacterium sp.]